MRVGDLRFSRYDGKRIKMLPSLIFSQPLAATETRLIFAITTVEASAVCFAKLRRLNVGLLITKGM